jgi:trehalose 6-phosphate phosphatase
VPDLTVGQSAADLDAAAAAVAAAPAPVLVAVDVDGTLSPLAPRADQAVLAPGAADALAALVAHGVPVAVVSGRGLDDLLHQFEWPGGLRMLGSHGLEDTAQQAVVPTAEERQRLQAVRTLAERAAAAVPGAWVEEKVAGVAFHYRQAKPASKGSVASQRLAERLSRLDSVWIRRGHLVLEASVRPGNKAEAVEWLRSEVGAGAVVFVGDDETDEDVFRAAAPGDVTVRVGPGETAARYRAADPAEVIDLLGRIASLSPSRT